MRKCILFFPLLALALQPVLLKEEIVSDRNATGHSKNDKYRVEYDYAPGNSEFIPIAGFTLYDASGVVVYRKLDFGHTLFDLADNGCVVGIDFHGTVSDRTVLNFYDAQGTKLRTAEIGFLLTRAFSQDGKVYCVNDGMNGVRVFTAQGEEMYNLGKANFCTVSPDGQFAALAREERIVVFRNGQRTDSLTIETPLVRQMVFSSDNTLLAYVTRNKLVVYHVPDRKEAFVYSLGEPEREYISMDIAPDNAYILAGLDEDFGRGSTSRHERGYIYLLDRSGRLVWQKTIDYTRWNISVPKVRFISDRGFEVHTATNIGEYQF